MPTGLSVDSQPLIPADFASFPPAIAAGLGAQSCAIWERAGESGRLELIAGLGIPAGSHRLDAGTGLPGAALAGRDLITVANLTSDERGGRHHDVVGLDMGPALFVPFETMMGRAGVIGIGRLKATTFTPYEATVAGAIGHWWALVLGATIDDEAEPSVAHAFLADRLRDLAFARNVIVLAGSGPETAAIAIAGPETKELMEWDWTQLDLRDWIGPNGAVYVAEGDDRIERSMPLLRGRGGAVIARAGDAERTAGWLIAAGRRQVSTFSQGQVRLVEGVAGLVAAALTIERR